MHALDTFATLLLDRLAWSSLQAVVLIALVAAVIRLRPQLPAAARCLLWWLVGLQLLVGLIWHAPVPLRWLAAPAPIAAPVPRTLGDTDVTVQGLPLMHTAPVVTAPLRETLVETGRSHWQLGLLALWLAGLALLFGKALRQAREARSLRRDSIPADDAALLALCIRRSRELHLRRCPPLRVCARIESPQVLGLLQPVILLPADHALSVDETAMAIDHELAHLRRGDLWTAWIPALAQRLFFFHPLVAWAMREYALHREAACDAQVLRQSGSAPQAYGRLLLRLGVSHPLHAGLAGASPTFENLKRRLTMLQQIESSSRLRGWLLVALIAAVGVVPYRVTARDHAKAAPNVADDPGLSVASPTAGTEAPATGYAWADADRVVINGIPTDSDFVRSLQRHGGPVLLVRQPGNGTYRLTDARDLAEVEQLMAPVIDSLHQQTALLDQHLALMHRRTALSGRQMELSAAGSDDTGRDARRHDLARQQAALAADESAWKSRQLAFNGRKNAAYAGADEAIARLATRAIAAGRASPVAVPTPAAAARVAPMAQVAPTPTVAPTPRTPAAPPTPPTPPPPPPAPMAPMAGSFAHHSHVSIDTNDDARNGFALFDGDSIIMRGTTEDVRTAQRQRKNGEPLLWVRRGDHAYVIRDPSLLARAKTIYAPIDALAKEQGKLGGKQGELGGRQGGLGAQQGELGRQQAELAAQQAALDGQRDADQRRAALDARQQSLEQRQAELSKQEEALGQQQEVLARQQEMLSRKQQQAYEKASRQMGELIDEAVAKGDAKAVPMR